MCHDLLPRLPVLPTYTVHMPKDLANRVDEANVTRERNGSAVAHISLEHLEHYTAELARTTPHRGDWHQWKSESDLQNVFMPKDRSVLPSKDWVETSNCHH